MENHAPHRSPKLSATRISDLLSEAASILTSAGIDGARGDARILLSAASGLSATALIADCDRTLETAAISSFATYVSRRVEREPVSRILGYREFWKTEFVVTPAVLDPRPATETIMDAALEAMLDRRLTALSILDLGTGCGALVCSLLLEFPLASGTACDISKQAIKVAQINAERTGVMDRLEFICANWTQLPMRTWDLIVSNPPYIESKAISELDAEVRRFDPLVSLDGGADGLDAYRRLAELVPWRLAQGGKALFEVGRGQAPSVAGIMDRAGLRTSGIRADTDGIDRVVEVETI